MTLTRSEIRQADDRKRDVVPCPEWNGEVCVRVMTGTQRGAFSQQVKAEGDDGASFDAVLMAHAACDEQGKPIFEPADAKWLSQEKNGAVVGRVAAKAFEVNELGQKASVEAAKKSEPTGNLTSG